MTTDEFRKFQKLDCPPIRGRGMGVRVADYSYRFLREFLVIGREIN